MNTFELVIVALTVVACGAGIGVWYWSQSLPYKNRPDPGELWYARIKGGSGYLFIVELIEITPRTMTLNFYSRNSDTVAATETVEKEMVVFVERAHIQERTRDHRRQ